jgi:dephospho-CoA kinase
MRVLGLTGGIGSGKSSVSAMLRKSGAAVVDCDLIAREVVEPGRHAYRRIVAAFGEGVVREDGTLNRPKLGEIVFKDADKRKLLQQITGPMIYLAILRRLLWHFCVGTAIVIVDAPTLLETKHLLHVVSKVIVVACSEPNQVARVLARDSHLTEELVRDRIKAQLPTEEEVKLADIVIRNDGSRDELEAAVARVVDDLDRQYRRGLSALLNAPCLVLALAALLGLMRWHGPGAA